MDFLEAFGSKPSLCLQTHRTDFSSNSSVLPYYSVNIPSAVKINRKSKNVSFNLHQLIIFHREKGQSYRQIAAMLNFKKSTVADIINRFKNEDRIDALPQRWSVKINK